MKMFGIKTLISGMVVALSLSATAHSQERVASLGGDLTEIIYALGEGDRIVATDSTSVFPPAAMLTPKVGYVRQLSAEGVLSVEPDMILISGAAGPDTALDQIRATGVPVEIMETAYTVDAIIAKTRRVSDVLGVEDAGEVLVGEIEADWAAAQAEVAKLGVEPTILFFSNTAEGTPTAAGDQTAAQGVINMLGGINVFGERIGYKPISLEAAVAADPDIILVMNFVAARIGGMKEVTNHPAISLTSAAQNDRIFMVDAVTVMQFSPRTPGAVGELAAEIAEKIGSPHGE
ncbi:MAG: ABC transporter substrate-binding protein [Pseudomonadota bacterium]